MRSAATVLIPFFLSCAHAEEPLQVLDAPENAFWHAESATWFVSSLGGGLSLERDGYGWVSRFDADGAVLEARWVDGLDAPTGMAAHDGRLYVADRGRVHRIDIAAARIEHTIPLPGAEFVNDVAATLDGRVFVSDTATNRIYEIERDGAAVWLESEALQSPNGLWAHDGALVVAAWGPMTDVATFATKHPGTLMRVDLGTRAITPIGKGEPIANFDGVVAVGDVYYATDWTGGRLLRISPRGEVSVVISGFEQLADLGVDPVRRRLGLPVMKDNRLILLSLE